MSDNQTVAELWSAHSDEDRLLFVISFVEQSFYIRLAICGYTDRTAM